MFVVVQGHRLGIDIRFERIGCVGKRGEGEGPSFAQSRQALLSYGGFGSGDGGQKLRSEGGAEEEFEEVTAGEVGHKGMMVGCLVRWQGDPAHRVCVDI